jgi:CopG family nickel-responsive transcriptional regulator
MKKIRRFSASLEPDILERIEKYRVRHALPTRSDALRALVRGEAVEQAWKGTEKAYAVITLLYNHHGRETMHRLTAIQHDAKVKVIITQHLHLTHSMCLEAITACGLPAQLEEFAAQLGAVRGVRRAAIARAAVATELD